MVRSSYNGFSKAHLWRTTKKLGEERAWRLKFGPHDAERTLTAPALCCPPPNIISILWSNDFISDKLDETTDFFECSEYISMRTYRHQGSFITDSLSLELRRPRV
jgi:hypothetical protein